MAQGPKKKPKHTKLVLPSEGGPAERGRKEKKDRLGRKTGGATGIEDTLHTPDAAATAPPAPQAEKNGQAHAPPVQHSSAKVPGQTGGQPLQSGAAFTPPVQGQPAPSFAATADVPLPDNAIVLPHKNPRLQAVRRKKRLRRIVSIVAVLLLLCGLWLYFSGLYLYAVMAAQNAYDSLRIRLTPGKGWPAPFSISGFITAQEMDGGGFAALGNKDMALFSSSGTELRRVQHGYANPGISTGNTRVCVYSRGGKEYAVEGRGGTVLRRSTEQDILFTAMSPGGTLAVVTSSRYRSNIEVYDPIYPVQPKFSWSMVDEKPVTGAFSSDNRNFSLACLSAEGGALGSTIYLLRTDKTQPLGTIRADDAGILQMEYIGQSRLLAVFDRYAALYNLKGEEVARYDYNGRNLLAADMGEGRLALVFGSSARDSYELALLNDRLQPLFEEPAAGTGTPRVLSAANGVYLLYGQDVAAFTLEGAQAEIRGFSAKPLDLVQAGEPLVLTVSSAEPLGELLGGGAQTPAAEPSSAASVGADASPAPSSMPNSA